MDRSVIPSILRELNIDADLVACIYNYGSWVYGTNSPSSDRDLMIVKRSSTEQPLIFNEELDYFHEFELHKLWNQYDVCVHTVDNFETLLEKNYLLAVECVFLPAEFKIKEDIDFQQIYLDKYYDRQRLKTVAFYENSISIKMYNLQDDTLYVRRSTDNDELSDSNKAYLFKNLFHGLRYLDVGEQLIQTKSIHDFKRVSHVLDEMKAIRDKPDECDTWDSVRSFVEEKSAEYKTRIDALVASNIIQGVFEVHVTVDCTHGTDEAIEKLKKACENTKYKVIFIDLTSHNGRNKSQQLMTSSYHCGEYPSIVPQIEEEVYKHFQDFNIIRVKIESLASNDGVPETDVERRLFWDADSNYFEFHYKVSVKNDPKGKEYERLRSICQRHYANRLHLSRNAFKKLDNDECHYIVTMRVFNMGRQNAFQASQRAVDYLTSSSFTPIKVVREFVVYDNHLELDAQWT